MMLKIILSKLCTHEARAKPGVPPDQKPLCDFRR
jgi:hypothetical protein